LEFELGGVLDLPQAVWKCVPVAQGASDPSVSGEIDDVVPSSHVGVCDVKRILNHTSGFPAADNATCLISTLKVQG